MSNRMCPDRNTWRSQRSKTRRQRFLASEREGQLYRHESRVKNSGVPLDLGDYEESEDDDKKEEDVDNEHLKKGSNIYSCLILGIKWWNLLKSIYPKIPLRPNKELMKSLKVSEHETADLREKFGIHPCRGDLKEIEEYLQIDLFLLVGGEFTNLTIAYRPERFSKPLTVRDVFKELEDANRERERPVVVLQSSLNFFNELGTFFFFPTYVSALKFAKKWKSIWELIVDKRWPKINNKEEKIKEIKKALALGNSEIWSIGDGVFKRLQQKFGVTVSIFVGTLVNDNRNEKTLLYTTDRWNQNKDYHLNILVAGFKEHEFYEEFKKITHISYQHLMKNPELRPDLIQNKQLTSFKKRSVDLKDEAIKRIYNWGSDGGYVPPIYQSESEDESLSDDSGENDDGDRISTFIVEDRTTYTRKKVQVPKNVAQFFDTECEVDSMDGQRGSSKSDNRNSSSESCSEDEFACEINGVKIGKIPKFDSKKWDKIQAPKPAPKPNVSFSMIRHTDVNIDPDDVARLEDFDLDDENVSSDESESREFIGQRVLDPLNEMLPEDLQEGDSNHSDHDTFVEADEPIINIINVAPNIFDNSTLCREIPERFIKMLKICRTPNCMMTFHNKTHFQRHMEKCSPEPKVKIKQKRCGLDLCDTRRQLFAEGFLPSETYFQKFFIAYDIESFMSVGPFTKEKKRYHNVVTIACCTSEFKRQAFRRENMDYTSGLELVIRFVNYLNHERKELVKKVPECIKRGIHFYNHILHDPEVSEKFTVSELASFREKLRYLQDFLKLKVYAWNGERYDLPVLYPMLMCVLYEFSARDGSKINVIKRGAGYMLIECNDICFRDFKNYTSPMTLEKLARSNGLNEDNFAKGCWPYEHFTTTAECEKAEIFTPYAFYRSTMYIRSSTFAVEFNEMIHEAFVKEAGKPGCWTNKEFGAYLDEVLQVDNIRYDPVLLKAFEDGKVNMTDDAGLPILDVVDY